MSDGRCSFAKTQSALKKQAEDRYNEYNKPLQSIDPQTPKASSHFPTIISHSKPLFDYGDSFYKATTFEEEEKKKADAKAAELKQAQEKEANNKRQNQIRVGMEALSDLFGGLDAKNPRGPRVRS